MAETKIVKVMVKGLQWEEGLAKEVLIKTQIIGDPALKLRLKDKIMDSLVSLQLLLRMLLKAVSLEFPKSKVSITFAYYFELY